MVVDHLLDSLALAGVAAKAGAPLADGARCVDVGTGAGFPGIPLAVAFPGTHWVLVESEGRKCEWLDRALVTFGEVEEVDPAHLGDVRFDLANALQKSDPVRARDLMILAKEAYGQTDRPEGKARIAEIDAWLKSP